MSTTSEKAIREVIAGALTSAVRALGIEGELPDLELGRAKGPDRGDYASPAGLKLAKVLKQAPPAIAAKLAETISIPEGAATVQAVGGYVNFRLTPEWLQRLVGEVSEAGPGYGASQMGGGERLQVEFASINPTGPLHIGHGRGTILGDSICRLLEFTGHNVQREYYVNDRGSQVERFGESIKARARGEDPRARLAGGRAERRQVPHLAAGAGQEFSEEVQFHTGDGAGGIGTLLLLNLFRERLSLAPQADNGAPVESKRK